MTRPGGSVLVAAFGPMPRAEFLALFFAAVREAVPDAAGPPMDAPPPPFQLADTAVFAARLREAGLHDVVVDTVVWGMPVASARDLWNAVTSSNPIGAQLVAGLDEEQRAAVLRVLDRALEERFGGREGGILTAPLNVGTGTV